MDINQLIQIVKKKISNQVTLEKIEVEDKTYLHVNHKSHTKNRYHLKIIISSKSMNKLNKIESTKIIYKILEKEINDYIHSLQILFI
tara:strand:+ start:185 stop:445 length:261 start_codon:yes stop_codon:yes gene_type:complete